MNEDRFAEPVVFKTGVHWNPTEYKSIDQTPYLAYLDKEEGKVRAIQTAHHWNGTCCRECEADISWCDNPPVDVSTGSRKIQGF